MIVTPFPICYGCKFYIDDECTDEKAENLGDCWTPEDSKEDEE